MAKSKQMKNKPSKKKTIFSQSVIEKILFYTFIAIVAIILYIISTFTHNKKKIVCEEQPPEVILAALIEGTPDTIKEVMKKVNCREVEVYRHSRHKRFFSRRMR
ncbi:hypothetical protein [uncultured Campylobacter sp.]|uniref:hypothetical protein n=1 Tax=uncultured Campylobacter sp. TaxID=218934 RepID=UPI00261C7C3D|nr:hypothetical protein [uncultured Campylobacter sp.]